MIAVEKFDANSYDGDIWLFDASRGVSSRSTFAPGRDSDPVWSPDGRQIMFASTRDRVANLYVMNAGGTGDERKLPGLDRFVGIYPLDWSPDGKFVLCGYREDPGRNIKALPFDGRGKPILVAGTKFEEVHGRFSPDGKWIAYASDESGQWEVYVQPFPPDGRKWVISKNGGAQPQWSRDGRELFYLSLDRRLQAVRVSLDSEFRVSTPTVLFDTGITSSLVVGVRNFYVPAADGQRFLFTLPVKQKAPELTVVLNWLASVTK